MSLRLGTFNVWGLPETFSDDVSSRMRAFAERLPAAELDVLLIQEAWTDEVRHRIRRAGEDAGFEVRGTAGGKGGLMILSRIPIRRSHFERFRFRGDPERFDKGEFLGGKGLFRVDLETQAGPVSVINTHLHARYRRARPMLNSAVRGAQLLQLVGALQELEGTVIVGGDFNCSRGEADYEMFSGLAGAEEVADGLGHPTLTTANYYKSHRSSPDKRIDFLFLRPAPGVEWRSTGVGHLFSEPVRIRERDRSLSDHFGFRADVDWSPSDQAVAVAWASPDPQAFELAHRLLEVGRAETDRREQVHSRMAGGWVAGALLAAGLRRHPAVDRRRFLRSSATVLAGLALAPAATFGGLAGFDAPHKRGAFDDAHDVLAQLEAGTRTRA